MKMIRLGAFSIVMMLLSTVNVYSMLRYAPTSAHLAKFKPTQIPGSFLYQSKGYHTAQTPKVEVSKEQLQRLQAEVQEERAWAKESLEKSKIQAQENTNQQNTGKKLYGDWAKWLPYLAASGIGTAAGVGGTTLWMQQTQEAKAPVVNLSNFEETKKEYQTYVNNNLIEAIKTRNIDKVKMALNQGANNFQEALMAAGHTYYNNWRANTNKEIILLLIDKGADKYVAARLMGKKNDSNFVKKLLQNESSQTLVQDIKKLQEEIPKLQAQLSQFEQLHQTSDSMALEKTVKELRVKVQKKLNDFQNKEIQLLNLNTTLADAVAHKNKDLIKFLIEKGATNLKEAKTALSISSTNMQDLIQWIDQHIKQKQKVELQEQQQKLKFLQDAKNKENMNILAQKNILAQIKKEIEAGNIQNIKSLLLQKDKLTPNLLTKALQATIQKKWKGWSSSTQHAIIQELINAGANPTIALNWAIEHKDNNLIDTIYDQVKTSQNQQVFKIIEDKTLAYAIMQNDVNFIQEILQNRSQTTKNNALLQAVQHNKLKAAEAIIESGAQDIKQALDEVTNDPQGKMELLLRRNL